MNEMTIPPKIWKMPITVESIEERSANTMASFLEIEAIEVGNDFLRMKMPITDKVRQPLGIMNGGASCVMAETAGSIAANYCVQQPQQYCVGLDINTNHLRSISDGYAYILAKPFHLGKTTQVWSIEISNDEGQLISVSRLTMAVMTRP